MEPWKSESNPGKQTLLAIVSIALGLALAVGFRHFDGSGLTNSKAGFLLGFFLFVVGIVAFLARGRQTVVVDPATQSITIEDNSPFGSRRRSIRFGEVAEVGIGYIGKRANFMKFYYLVLKLRSGERYPLFAPGRFYPGGSDRSVVEGWRLRLENYLWPQT